MNFSERTKEQKIRKYNLLHTFIPLINILSFLMADQVLRTLTLQASVLSNPLTNGKEVDNQHKKGNGLRNSTFCTLEIWKEAMLKWPLIHLHKYDSQASALTDLNLKLCNFYSFNQF